jgi:NAD(P)-dependent dehydrogenase (short-subunit alcohol dehydrogenase family)
MTAGRFAGRVAVITGGSSGMGLATAQRWVADGGRAVIGDVSPLPDEVAAGFGPDVRWQHCDVRDEAAQEELVSLALGEFGRVDAAVAGPALIGSPAIVNMDLERWRDILDVTLTGVMLTIKHAARAMVDGGAIVTIASVNARQPGRGVAAYNSAKAGLVMLSKVAAMELAHRRIRVNSVSPGLIETALTTPMLTSGPLMDDWYENTLLGRHGRADEVASLICHLCSDESAFITGEDVTIDGGIHLMRYPDLPTHRGTPLDPVEGA